MLVFQRLEQWRLGSVFLCLLASLWLVGCGEKIIYQDRPVEFDLRDAKQQSTGERFLLPGIYEEQLFKKLNDGDALHIIQGFQGGTWIHLSVRVSGMPTVGRIKATVSEGIATIEYDIHLVRTAEGFLEAYDIPIPIKQEGAALEALYGKKAILEVTFSAQGKTISATRKVTLTKG